MRKEEINLRENTVRKKREWIVVVRNLVLDEQAGVSARDLHFMNDFMVNWLFSSWTIWFRYCAAETTTTRHDMTRDWIPKNFQFTTILCVCVRIVIVIVIHLMRVFLSTYTHTRAPTHAQNRIFVELFKKKWQVPWVLRYNRSKCEKHLPEMQPGNMPMRWTKSRTDSSADVRLLIEYLMHTNELNVAENKMNFPWYLNCSAECEHALACVVSVNVCVFHSRALRFARCAYV